MLIGPGLCWCVAVLAAALVAVVMVAIVVGPAVREVRVVPAGPPNCGATPIVSLTGQ